MIGDVQTGHELLTFSSGTTIAGTTGKGRGIQGGHDPASANFPLFFYPLCVRGNERFGVPDRIEGRGYPGGVGGPFQPIIQLLQFGWTGGQLRSIELGCSGEVVRSGVLEKRIVRVWVCREGMATIMRSTVIRTTEPGVGRQKLSAFGTNGSQSLGLGRYIYTFGLLNTPGIDDLLRAI
jgi:hypothetical protein